MPNSDNSIDLPAIRSTRFFVRLILWSTIAPIDAAVVAPAQVAVESSRKVLQHLEGGVVRSIHVSEGQIVAKGELLLELDQTTASVDTEILRDQLSQSYARRSRLQAERDNLSSLPAATGVAAIIQSAQFGLHIQNERKLYASRVSTNATELSLIEQKIVQQQERINGLDSQLNSLQKQISFNNEQLRSTRELYKKRFVARNKVREIETKATTLSGELGANRAMAAEAASLIAEATLERERLSKSVTQDAIEDFRKVSSEINELEERLRAADDRLQRTQIVSPQNGRGLNLTAHTLGGVVEPGEPILEIVPNGDQLIITAQIEPRNIDRISTGQQSFVRFSALGGRQSPEVSGTVQHVAADSLVDDKTGRPFYLVKLALPSAKELSAQLNGQKIIPGMPVEAFIRTGSQPAISYLLRPLSDSIARSFREQ